MTMRITHYGETILRQKGAPVTHFDKALLQLAEEMVDTMYEAEGIGLAAQQVGKALQFCVVDVRPAPGEPAPFYYKLDGKTPPLDLIMPLAIANPEIAILDPTESTYEEGCLSFPGIQAKIVRPIAISVTFANVDGKPHTLECDGLLARCILHEVDHLNGVLFIDHLGKKDRKKIAPRVDRLKAKTIETFGDSSGTINP